MEDLIVLSIILILALYIYNQYNRQDNFQSYAYPWRESYGWDWNWWRRWMRPRNLPGVGWKPGCPAGCRFVGGKQRWGCPVPSLEYGNYGCKYDSECKGCDWY